MINPKKIALYTFFLSAFFSIMPSISVTAQDRAVFREPGSNLWVGSYNTVRLAEKWLWVGQVHYRRAGYDGIPYVGRMGQLYNRHAISYVYNKNLVMALGGVLRLNFTPDPGNDAFETMTYEPRIWHEYMFILPIDRLVFYHRVRIEHRWSLANAVGSDWVYRDRWRYKIFTNIPLNKKSMQPGTIYFTPDVEIIMQTGSTITHNVLEDLRIYPQIGYVASPRVKYGIGMMYTTGQTDIPWEYSQRWVFRLNMYLSLDMRKFETKIPDIHFTD